MTFEESKRRPVYVVQCRTWKKAAELGLCCLGIRAVRGQRGTAEQLARDFLALAVRNDRLKQRMNRR